MDERHPPREDASPFIAPCGGDKGADAGLIALAQRTLEMSDQELALLLGASSADVAAWKAASMPLPDGAVVSIGLACSMVTVLGCRRDELKTLVRLCHPPRLPPPAPSPG